MISHEGEQLGVYDLDQALIVAEEAGLDLVEVGSSSNPPVCKIMDYGKYKYELSKKQHEAKKKQKTVIIKEIKLRPKTGEHDLQFKLKHTKQFLSEGNKVKVTVSFRGRENAFQQQGIELLKRIAKEVSEIGAVEKDPASEGRTAMMILTPKK